MLQRCNKLYNFLHIFSLQLLQMAGVLGRLASPGGLATIALGSAAAYGAYRYTKLEAGSAPGEYKLSA